MRRHPFSKAGLSSLGPSAPPQDLTTQVLQRLEQIENSLKVLVHEKTVKDFYTIAEVAEVTGRAAFTVREWARLGRIHASKRRSGRGTSLEWMVSHQELVRFRNEGLLPREINATYFNALQIDRANGRKHA